MKIKGCNIRFATVAFFIITVPFLGLACNAHAQAPLLSLPSGKEAPSVLPDSLHRETPRNSFQGFIKAMDTGNYQLASQYLEALPGKKPEEIQGILDRFRTLLDQGYWESLDSITDEPLGNLADGLKPEEESVGTIKVGSQKLELILKRIKTEGGRDLWFVSRTDHPPKNGHTDNLSFSGKLARRRSYEEDTIQR